LYLEYEGGLQKRPPNPALQLTAFGCASAAAERDREGIGKVDLAQNGMR
jgi:hypothetical protein